MYWFSSAMMKCFQYSGRSSRKEYWYFFLACIVLALFVGFLQGIVNGTAHAQGQTVRSGAFLIRVFQLLILLPSISITVRRLHDTGRSGWWILIGFIPVLGLIIQLVWMAQRGTTGSNRFGDDPLQPRAVKGPEETGHSRPLMPDRPVEPKLAGFGKRQYKL